MATEFLKGKKEDVRPSSLFLVQIGRYFGKAGEREGEEVLNGFRAWLEERKRGLLGGGEKMDDEVDETEGGGGV